jgi:hypothetical protein
MTNRRTRYVALAALAVAALAARPAEARLLDLRAGARAGGMAGWGTTPNTPDFFERKRGPGLGIEVGARLLIFDFSASFTQLFDGNGTNGTFTQGLVGIAIDVPVGNQLFQGGIENGKSRNIIRPTAGVGAGVGTPEPVHPPLDNAQISDKGLFPYAGIGFEHFLNEFMGVGAQADFAYHYFFGGGKTSMVNPMMMPTYQTYSTGYHFSGFATFTFHLGV